MSNIQSQIVASVNFDSSISARVSQKQLLLAASYMYVASYVYVATSSSLLVLLIILVLIINPLPPAGVKYLWGRRPLNHPLPLNDPPIGPLYPRILLLRRGHEGQRTEVMRRQIKGRTIIPLTIEQPPPKKC